MQIGKDIFSMWLLAEKISSSALPGQFVNVYTGDPSRLLPRPISLCDVSKEKGAIRLVYRVTGKNTGTESFSRLREGESLSVLGPLGNGYPLELLENKNVLLLGGGVGIPPMLYTARALSGQHRDAGSLPGQRRIAAVLGFRDERFLEEEFFPFGETFVSTEDGSYGTRGNVLDVVREKGLKADAVLACGPRPMLRAVKAWALMENIPCYISMEERMACGIGACLGCVAASTDTDSHTQVKNKRVCKEGPVFLSTEVEL